MLKKGQTVRIPCRAHKGVEDNPCQGKQAIVLTSRKVGPNNWGVQYRCETCGGRWDIVA